MTITIMMKQKMVHYLHCCVFLDINKLYQNPFKT